MSRHVTQAVTKPSYLRRAITEEADLGFSSLQPNGLYNLGISWNKIDGLVAPFHVLAFDI